MSTRRLTALSFLFSTLLLTSLSYAQTYLVKRVIDGDTIQLSNGERVRLIGVDTPETKHPKKPVKYFGKEAYAFTKRMVEDSKGIDNLSIGSDLLPEFCTKLSNLNG